MTKRIEERPSPPRRLLSTNEAARYMGMSKTLFVASGIPLSCPPVRVMERKWAFDIRDLDALIEYTKERGSMEGFRRFMVKQKAGA